MFLNKELTPCVSITCGFVKLTWIRLFPQSATMMFPLASTATPVGSVELSVPFSMGTEFKQELPVGVVHLQGEITQETLCCHTQYKYVEENRIRSIFKNIFMITQLFSLLTL